MSTDNSKNKLPARAGSTTHIGNLKTKKLFEAYGRCRRLLRLDSKSVFRQRSQDGFSGMEDFGWA